MMTFADAPPPMRRLSHIELLGIANGDIFSRAHTARAELQRRAIVRNMVALCITVMVMLLTGLAFIDLIMTT